MTLQPRAHGPLHRPLRRQPRRHAPAANRNYGDRLPDRAAGRNVRRCCSARRSRLGAAGVPDDAGLSDHASTPANSVNMFDPDIKTPYVQPWSVGFQRSLGRDMAVEIRYVGNRNMNAWTTENWNERETSSRTASSTSSSCAQANLRAQRRGAAAANRHVRLHGPGTGTSPLPTYLAYFSGAARVAGRRPRRATRRRTSRNIGVDRPPRPYYEPDPADAANDLHANTTFRANALDRGPAGELLRDEPGRRPTPTSRGRWRARATTRCSSSCAAGSRTGLLVNGNYTYAQPASGSSLAGAAPAIGSTSEQRRDVPHAFKMHWIYEIPVGRGRRFGADMNPLLERGRSATGSSRAPAACSGELFDLGSVQARRHDAERAAERLQDPHACDRDTGAITVFSFPQDIIDNTRRALQHRPDVADRLRRRRRADRPLHRAGQHARTASPIYAGDCGAPQQMLLRGPLVRRASTCASRSASRSAGRRASSSTSKC